MHAISKYEYNLKNSALFIKMCCYFAGNCQIDMLGHIGLLYTFKTVKD
jgi:hypothetical protein